MPAVAEDPGSLSALVTKRWQAIDPLLPDPAAPAAGCGAELVVPGPDGQPAAIGTCEHWEGEPGSLDLSWGAARRFMLSTQIAGPDIGGALDRLLSLWREHLAGVPGSAEPDTAAVVTWPSRDIDGVGTLLRHGLAPLGVVAARTMGRRPGRAGNGNAGPADGTGVPGQDLRIRRAGLADLEAVARLGLEVIRYDAHFGGVIERPGTLDALRSELPAMLAGEAWTWLAERDGTPIGLLAAERPEAAGWIAPMVRLSPVAYLMLMVVAPEERGTGTGTMMVARLHGEISAAGVPVTLLHYEQTNPLSAPFWNRQGYRPLWTSWEARPAGTLR
jgi:GNAT superfamily N-acetyltransferase